MEKHYYAHSPSPAHPNGQLLSEHLKNAAVLARRAASVFGAEAAGEYAGLLHDIGKYADKFQRRLAGAGERVDHSTAGAYEAFQKKAVPAAFAIAGHHAGLPDYGTKFDTEGKTLRGRLRTDKIALLEDYSAFRSEIGVPETPPIPPFVKTPIELYFYTKMLFSCLVDADWSDTGGDGEETYASVEELEARLEKRLAAFSDSTRELDRLRNAIRDAVLEHAEDRRGLFSLTVPTGGGKTLTSMAFSLRHARMHGLRRIIYVIPYCSILEQTGKDFREIFGERNVLLHASNIEIGTRGNFEGDAFVSERWDAPIVLTTSVQFFESLFAAKPSRCRKLHNICDSVIVFDEAQMLPVPYMRPCVGAICRLTEDYGCTAVLCTATQPSLGKLIETYAPGAEIVELCPAKAAEAAVFHRVTYRFEGRLDDEALAKSIAAEKQVLCIVNNRRQAQQLCETLLEQGDFCLTTLLTPHDRGLALESIRARLHEGSECRVISTSLVEAGVDLDFPCVYRAVSGLDSMIQAGGRCNREGKRAAQDSIVHIFLPDAAAPRRLAQNIAAAERIIGSYPDDLASPAAIQDYFDFLLYVLKDEKALDLHGILQNAEKLNFATVSDDFRIIDDEADALLYIPGDGGDGLLGQLEAGQFSRALLRQAAQYAVSLPNRVIDGLIDRGKAKRLHENGALLTDTDCYDAKVGFVM